MTVKKVSQQDHDLNASAVMQELEALGTAQIKKVHVNHGAREPLFGVTIGAMKPLAKKIKRDYALSMELYETGNYDAMYFAGMIADPQQMTQADFEKWMERAYCPMVPEFVVSVTLAETVFAQSLSDKWIARDMESYESAGWSCYGWLLGYRPDAEFDPEKLKGMLKQVERTIHDKPERTKYAMNSFVIAVGVSYLPLYEEAVKTATSIGKVEVHMGKTSCQVPLATAYIAKAADKGRLGFKRKNLWC